MRKAATPSPMPKVFTINEEMTDPLMLRKKGTALSCSMGSSSEGGPGSMSTQRPSPAGVAQPGAVPARLGKATDPRGNMACLA